VVANPEGADWERVWSRACKSEHPAIILRVEPRENYEIAILVAGAGTRKEKRLVPDKVNSVERNIR
jgi:hypothetical protein